MTPQRLERVRALIEECKTTGEIEKQLSVEWDVSRQTIYNYVTKVFKILGDNNREHLPFRKDRMRERMEEQVKVCREAKEYAAANRALELLGKIDGVFDPIKLELSGPAGGVIPIAVEHSLNLKDLSDDELAAFEKAVVKLEPQK